MASRIEYSAHRKRELWSPCYSSTCRNAKELHSYMHWRVPFIEDILECCTSGLVANREVKSTPRASLHKGTVAMPRWQVAWMLLGGLESHLVAGVLMHI